MNDTVYVPMSTDFLHPGHLNIIKVAAELGRVVIGLLTDKAIAVYKRLPVLDLEQRRTIFESIKDVADIVIQDDASFAKILIELKPKYVVHGDDWQTGPQSQFRAEVIALLQEWGGQLVEPPYTKGLSSSHLNAQLNNGVTADIRRSSLKRLLAAKSLVKILEVHNGLTGLIAERTCVEVAGQFREFDGMWESSLTDSASKGKPDTQAVDISSRVNTIDQILEVTTKPMIVDADNGNLPEHFAFTVRTLERLGVSAVIIEDKTGAKRNSLFGTEIAQCQDTIEHFTHKIAVGKRAQISDDFMIFARIESLILQCGLEDAMQRAQAYVAAGADGIMVHSKEPEPNEIVAFCRLFRKFSTSVPLIVVPSTYSAITEDELQALQVNVVIYANHLLRSAFPAMQKVARSILHNKRCHEASEWCMPIKEIITLIPETV